MKNKEKVQYLMQYRYLTKEIEQIKSSHNYLCNKLISIPAQVLKDTPASGGYNRDAIINNIKQLERLEEFLEKRIDILTQVKQKIEEKIMEIKDPLTRQIFHLRYIDGCKWSKICCCVLASERSIHLKHSRALTDMIIEE